MLSQYLFTCSGILHIEDVADESMVLNGIVVKHMNHSLPTNSRSTSRILMLSRTNNRKKRSKISIRPLQLEFQRLGRQTASTAQSVLCSI